MQLFHKIYWYENIGLILIYILIIYDMGMNMNYIGKSVVRFPGTTSSVCADMSNSSLVTFWRQTWNWFLLNKRSFIKIIPAHCETLIGHRKWCFSFKKQHFIGNVRDGSELSFFNQSTTDKLSLIYKSSIQILGLIIFLMLYFW